MSQLKTDERYELEEQQEAEQFELDKEEKPSKEAYKQIKEQKKIKKLYEEQNQKKLNGKHKAKFTRRQNKNHYYCDNCN